MKEFIFENYLGIIAVALIAVTVAVLTALGKKRLVSGLLYCLVTEAERMFGSGRGGEKLAYVMERAYGALPSPIRMLVSYDRLRELVELALSRAKEIWAKEAEITA